MAEAAAAERAASLSPSTAYQLGIDAGRWRDDPGQRAALGELDRIHTGLLDQTDQGLLHRLRTWIAPPTPVPGLYLWGGVGRGKTFLVDLLFDGLAIAAKRRIHFHRFMAEIHDALRQLKRQPDPLAAVADIQIRRQRLLVLDEFFVSDIGDAMILARLLDALFARGLTLVTTSNVAPSDLYRDGLQRVRFLPAIALIEARCRVLRLTGDTDYRLRLLTRDSVYRHPLDSEAETAMATWFQRLSEGVPIESGPVSINGRAIPTRGLAEGIAWFDFPALCEGPRSAADYIELARDRHTVLISGIPVFDGGNDDAARRLVNLIDELYDRRVNLIVSAADPPQRLYRGERLAAEFERTASRLIEMQSRDYLGQPHRP
ncbi:MAG TPA: cell division protein ZapE [Xanthomonadales bacterium]|nr:cell division protein ZapE [Xanthomonadales bacterium]